jgi:hypothetical protein
MKGCWLPFRVVCLYLIIERAACSHLFWYVCTCAVCPRQLAFRAESVVCAVVVAMRSCVGRVVTGGDPDRIGDPAPARSNPAHRRVLLRIALPLRGVDALRMGRQDAPGGGLLTLCVVLRGAWCVLWCYPIGVAVEGR